MTCYRVFDLCSIIIQVSDHEGIDTCGQTGKLIAELRGTGIGAAGDGVQHSAATAVSIDGDAAIVGAGAGSGTHRVDGDGCMADHREV